jgi:AraC-like DNA-binding protein
MPDHLSSLPIPLNRLELTTIKASQVDVETINSATLRFKGRSLLERIDVLAKLIYDLTGEDGVYKTAMPGIYLSRFSGTNPPRHMFDRAVFCVVAQGVNSILLPREVWTYAPGKYFLASLDLPITAQLVKATREEPYLGLTIELDFAEISSLVLDNGDAAGAIERTDKSAYIGSLDEALLDALIRLVRLFKTPAHIPVLAPLVHREIFFHLLNGSQSGLLKKMAVRNSQVRHIAVAVEQLKRNFAKPIRIKDLARRANMSPASLHSWFKAVTAMSPLQFQKRLRLQEARRILYTESDDVATVSYRVGYESPSQLSRDYKRLFGSPPRKDIEHLRRVSGGLNAVPRELPAPQEGTTPAGEKVGARRSPAKRRTN